MKKIFSKYQLICLLQIILPVLLFTQKLPAQENYVFRHITAEDGLKTNSMVKGFQDEEGYYWFATVYGVQKFDGKNFTSYQFNYAPATQVKKDDWTNICAEDNEKNIWFINLEGISIFYRKISMLKRLYLPDAPDSNINNVVAVVKDVHHNLWIVTNRDIFLYDYSLHKPVLYCKIFTDDKLYAQSAQYDKTQDCFWLLIADQRKIIRFDIRTKKISYPVNQTAFELLKSNNPISFFKVDDDENLWMADYAGDFCRYDLVKGKNVDFDYLHKKSMQEIGTPNSTITDAIDDGNGSVWFGGDYHLGLFRYEKKSGDFIPVINNTGSEYGFHYNEIVYSFFLDNEQNIWVNTDLGMNIFNPHAQVFKYVNTHPGNFVTKFSADISSVFQSSTGSIWVCTWGDGVFEYSSNFSLLHHYVHDKNNPSSFGEPLNRAWCIAEDNKGRLWIGCQYGMLSMFDTVEKKFTNMVVPQFNSATIMHAVKTKDAIWFGLFSGVLAKLDEATGNIIVYNNAFTKPSNIVSPVDGICVDKSGNIWWSPGTNGIRKFDVVKNAVVDSSLNSLHISSPAFINDSMLLGGTDTKGLLIFNTKTKKPVFFNTVNGLSSNDVYGALALSKNRIWIFANNGVKLMNLRAKKISEFNMYDGIRDYELQGPFYLLQNGNILFAARSGLVYFNPDEIKTKPPPPDVRITEFKINNHNISVDSLLQQKNISLNSKQDILTIGYASLSFNGRLSNKYFYRLSGIDKDWVAAGDRRSVTYANLAPGEYIFNVKVVNADGVQAKNITSLDIIIHSPWYKTWWAFLLWFLLASFIVYSIYNYRKRNREALSAIRQKIASDLHDDIGSTLNSISVYSEIAGNQLQNNPENAKDILHKMGDASRNMIDIMNDIVWAVHPKNDQFENVLERMQYFAAELLSGKNILLDFSVDEKIKNTKLSMEKRKNLYLVFKEALNNAYKYSGTKVVHVKIEQPGNFLLMKITDEGVGFDAVKNSLGGNGLKNMQQRATEVNAQIQVNSIKEKGTEVVFKMFLK